MNSTIRNFALKAMCTSQENAQILSFTGMSKWSLMRQTPYETLDISCGLSTLEAFKPLGKAQGRPWSTGHCTPPYPKHLVWCPTVCINWCNSIFSVLRKQSPELRGRSALTLFQLLIARCTRVYWCIALIIGSAQALALFLLSLQLTLLFFLSSRW